MDKLKVIINRMYDANVFKKISGSHLHSSYIKSPSVIRRVQKLKNILKQHNISNMKSQKIVEEMVYDIIPAGVKASVRGSALNAIVNNKLKRLPKKRYSVTTEHTPAHLKPLLHERPDWVVKDLKTQHTIIGYTQVSLFGGGQQINRASKYILNEDIHMKLRKNNASMVCLVAEKPTILKKGTKCYNILTTGIKKKRLLLLRGLVSHITSSS